MRDQALILRSGPPFSPKRALFHTLYTLEKVGNYGRYNNYPFKILSEWNTILTFFFFDFFREQKKPEK